MKLNAALQAGLGGELAGWLGFKNYGDFAEWVHFAYWWSLIKKGLRLTGLPRLVSISRLLSVVDLVYNIDSISVLCCC